MHIFRFFVPCEAYLVLGVSRPRSLMVVCWAVGTVAVGTCCRNLVETFADDIKKAARSANSTD